MAVRKLGISLPEELVDAVEHRVEVAGAGSAGITLSSWLAEAARHQLRREEGLEAVAEWEAEHGPIPEDLAAATDTLVRAIGAGAVPGGVVVLPGADPAVVKAAEEVAARRVLADGAAAADSLSRGPVQRGLADGAAAADSLSRGGSSSSAGAASTRKTTARKTTARRSTARKIPARKTATAGKTTARKTTARRRRAG